MPLGIVVAVAYLVISAAQVALADNPHVALGGFELAPWFLSTVLVVASAVCVIIRSSLIDSLNSANAVE